MTEIIVDRALPIFDIAHSKVNIGQPNETKTVLIWDVLDWCKENFNYWPDMDVIPGMDQVELVFNSDAAASLFKFNWVL